MLLVCWISRDHSRAPGGHESARQCYLRRNEQRLFSPQMCRCLPSPWLWACQTLSSQLKLGSLFLTDHLYVDCKEIQDPCQLSELSARLSLFMALSLRFFIIWVISLIAGAKYLGKVTYREKGLSWLTVWGPSPSQQGRYSCGEHGSAGHTVAAGEAERADELNQSRGSHRGFPA